MEGWAGLGAALKETRSMTRAPYLLVLLAFAAALPRLAEAHCEIPCGIYGDELRFEMLEEHLQTIEKSMRKAAGMERTGNGHQLTRWILNKERHAGEVQDIVTRYFLTQRVIPVEPGRKDAFEKYQRQLILLHKMLFFASKAKQGTELSHVASMRKTLSEFRDLYMGGKDGHKH